MNQNEITDIKVLMRGGFDQAFMTQIGKLYQVYIGNAPTVREQQEHTRKGIEKAIEAYRLAIEAVNDWNG